MSVHTVYNGQGQPVRYETFDSLAEIAVGHIVRLPDGRAGEVREVHPGMPWVLVRAWDEYVPRDVELARLEAYVEEDSSTPAVERRRWSEVSQQEKDGIALRAQARRIVDTAQQAADAVLAGDRDLAINLAGEVRMLIRKAVRA